LVDKKYKSVIYFFTSKPKLFMSTSKPTDDPEDRKILTSWDYSVLLDWLFNDDTTHSKAVLQTIARWAHILTQMWDKTLETLIKNRINGYSKAEIEAMIKRIDALWHANIGTPLKNVVNELTSPASELAE
jgi:hypothetical protein